MFSYIMVLSVCNSGCNDVWPQYTASKLQCCNDLVAEEAKHHFKVCYDCFHLGKPPLGVSVKLQKSTARASHRPLDAKKQASFLIMCHWLESQTDRYLYSTPELHSKLLESDC